MRQLRFFAFALVVAACGPDPNARLPGSPVNPPPSGGSGQGNGGSSVPTGTDSGGATTPPSASGGAAGSNPFAGGAAGASPFAGGAAGSSPFGSGGASGGTKTSSASGGAAGSSPFGSGGGAGSAKTGGTTASSGGSSGTGGTTSASTSYTWGVGPEPCASPKDLSCASGNGQTGNFGNNTEFCFRTADIIAGWSCNNLTGWTMKINGQVVECSSGTVSSSTLPPALNGIYYFDFIGSASALTWASLSWYANTGNCKAGPYPSWSAGGTTPPPTADAGSSSGG